MMTMWVPSAIRFGVYAPQEYIPKKSTITRDLKKAMRFYTKEQCTQWCVDNPVPMYVPVEMAFFGEEVPPSKKIKFPIVPPFSSPCDCYHHGDTVLCAVLPSRCEGRYLCCLQCLDPCIADRCLRACRG